MKRQFRETFMKYLFLLIASVSILAVALICFFLLYNGNFSAESSGDPEMSYLAFSL